MEIPVFFRVEDLTDLEIAYPGLDLEQTGLLSAHYEGGCAVMITIRELRTPGLEFSSDQD